MTTQTRATLEVAKIDTEQGLNARTRQCADGRGRLSAPMSSSQTNKGEVAL
jgi:hypothetical protein